MTLTMMALFIQLNTGQTTWPPQFDPPTGLQDLIPRIDAFFKERWPQAPYTPSELIRVTLRMNHPGEPKDEKSRMRRLLDADPTVGAVDCYWFIAATGLMHNTMSTLPRGRDQDTLGNLVTSVDRRRKQWGTRSRTGKDFCDGPGGTAAMNEWASVSSSWHDMGGLLQDLQRGGQIPCRLSEGQVEQAMRARILSPMGPANGAALAAVASLTGEQRALLTGAIACSAVSWTAALAWMLQSPQAYQAALGATR